MVYNPEVIFVTIKKDEVINLVGYNLMTPLWSIKSLYFGPLRSGEPSLAWPYPLTRRALSLAV